MYEKCEPAKRDFSRQKSKLMDMVWDLSPMPSNDPQWYTCDDCGIAKHISELTDGCPLCGQTMVPL